MSRWSLTQAQRNQALSLSSYPRRGHDGSLTDSLSIASRPASGWLPVLERRIETGPATRVVLEMGRQPWLGVRTDGVLSRMSTDEFGEARPLRIGIAGEVMLGRLVNDVVLERGAGYPWGDLRPTLQALDAFLVNLECAVTSRVEKWRNGYYRPFHFRADAVALDTLHAGRVDLASIANNHIGD